MISLRQAAQIEHEKRERQREADRLEHEQRLCSETARDFTRQFQDSRNNFIYPETIVYNRGDRRVEMGFDGGVVTIARTNPGVPRERTWRVVLACPDCGQPMLSLGVDDLADIGQVLAQEPRQAIADAEWDHHYCAPRDTGRQLSEYLTEDVA